MLWSMVSKGAERSRRQRQDSNGTDKNTQHAKVVKRGFVDRTLIRYRLRIKIRDGSPEGIRVTMDL